MLGRPSAVVPRPRRNLYSRLSGSFCHSQSTDRLHKQEKPLNRTGVEPCPQTTAEPSSSPLSPEVSCSSERPPPTHQKRTAPIPSAEATRWSLPSSFRST